MKSLSKGKMWCFGIGQLGYAILSGLISNWLVYFYQPNQASINDGQTLFIPQGVVVLGIFTIIGGITALGRVFDAVTDPWIASLSDKCTHKLGRRIPFMKYSAFPLALITVLVFWTPVGKVSAVNSVWLLITILLYYVAITAYCTPYTALIPELGHTDNERVNISTIISLTFIVGTATAYAAPVVWGALTPAFGRVTAMRVTFIIFAVIAFFCMMVPVFTIKEKEYVNSVPSNDNAMTSLVKTFKNRNFRIFVGSDILYWIALTMFQTGLPFFVTTLLGLGESMATIYFVLMTALSLVFYLPINKLAKKFGKKRLVLIAFVMFSAAFLFTAFFGSPLGFSPTAQGYILCFVAAFPMAIFGILPQAMVADVAEDDAKATKANREGMFYAARTFSFKLGQSISMLIFTAVATIGSSTGTGYRIVAATACFFCLLGGVILLFFKDKKPESN